MKTTFNLKRSYKARVAEQVVVFCGLFSFLLWGRSRRLGILASRIREPCVKLDGQWSSRAGLSHRSGVTCCHASAHPHDVARKTPWSPSTSLCCANIPSGAKPTGIREPRSASVFGKAPGQGSPHCTEVTPWYPHVSMGRHPPRGAPPRP